MDNNKIATEQKNNDKKKWLTAIVLLGLFAPAGVIYIWKEKQFFSKKIYLFLWVYGGVTLVISIILLAVWLPEIKSLFRELDLNFPIYPSIFSFFVAFLSTVQIIFGLVIDKKQSSLQPLPKSYLTVALVFLVVNLILIPLIIIPVQWSVFQQLYKKLITP